MPYRAYLAEQFSIAYDVYLEIIDRVDKLILSALGRDSENWRVRHACPACFYKLEGEAKLKYSFFCQMDGNNSLKRTNAMVQEVDERLDTRRSRSDYWLTPAEVDRFKDEVKVCMYCSTNMCDTPAFFCRLGRGRRRRIAHGATSLQMIPVKSASSDGRVQDPSSVSECGTCLMRLGSSPSLVGMVSYSKYAT